MSFMYREKGGVGFYEVTGCAGARGVFTTRRGGVSPAPFYSLNMGAGGGDDPRLVEKNRALVAGALGIDPAMIKTGDQVHGDAVWVVEGRDAGKPEGGCDALITRAKGVAVGVLTADCAAILLHDCSAGAVGAVHAGWAGTVKGIVAKAVREMAASFGTDPAAVKACIGPSVGPCCYEVDEKVMGPLREAVPGWEGLVSRTRPGHWRLDIWKANKMAMLEAGLRPENICIFGACTKCNPDKFYSHRGSGGRTGRMLALTYLTEGT